MRWTNSLLIRLFSMLFLINQVCIRKLILDIFLPIQRKIILCFLSMNLLKIRCQKMSLSLTSNYAVSSQNLHLESKKGCILLFSLDFIILLRQIWLCMRMEYLCLILIMKQLIELLEKAIILHSSYTPLKIKIS